MIKFIAGLLLNALRATPIATDADTAGRLLATAAAGPRPGDSGAYIDQGKIAPSSPASYGKDREEELWAAAARLTHLGPEPARAVNTARRTPNPG